LALTQQQNEFLAKKIDDLQKQNDSVVERYEEKLSNKNIFIFPNERLEIFLPSYKIFIGEALKKASSIKI
jgi:hypothetical protein